MGNCSVDCGTCSLYRKSSKQTLLPKFGSLHSSLSCSTYLVVIFMEHACLHCMQVLTCTVHIRTFAQYNAKEFARHSKNVENLCKAHRLWTSLLFGLVCYCVCSFSFLSSWPSPHQCAAAKTCGHLKEYSFDLLTLKFSEAS